MYYKLKLHNLWVWLFFVMGPAVLIFSLFLFSQGLNPFFVFAAMYQSAVASQYAVGQTILKAIPIVFTAYSVSLAYAGGLVTLGGEGQMNIGAIGATLIALSFPRLPSYCLLPLMFMAGCFLAGAWSGLAGLGKSFFDANETIVTLLLNYIAILLVKYLVFGPLKATDSFNFPQSEVFPPAAILPAIFSGRVHLGLLLALLVGVGVYWLVYNSHAGFMIRIVGKNLKVARYKRIRYRRIWVYLMIVSGGIAGMAGVCEVSAVQGRLRPDISIGLGYTGFLVSWLSRHNYPAIPVVAFGVAAVISAGDSLQIFAGLPYATVEVFQGIIFLSVMFGEYFFRRYRRDDVSVAKR